jgi:predicted TPR repeat methyltransferase
MEKNNRQPDETDLVKKRFDKLAETYEQALTRFKYFGVDHLYRVFLHHIEDGSQIDRFDILDLGCGTGLCGQKFKPFARKLDGVDLSPKMLDVARNLGIYDQLHSDDVQAYLTRAQPNTYDLVTAAGLFVYLNKLQTVFARCFSVLRPGGMFVFTIDRHVENVKDVMPRPRSGLMFTFSREYVERSLHSAGFQLITVETIDDRLNWHDQAPVPAFAVLAKRPGT